MGLLASIHYLTAASLRFSIPIVFVFQVLMLTNLAHAQEELPTAQQVIDDYMEALGGELSLRGLELVTMSGRVDREPNPKGEPNATFVFRFVGNKYLNTHTIIDGEEYHFGYDGSVSWQESEGQDRVNVEKNMKSSYFMSKSPTQVLSWLDMLDRVTVHGFKVIDGRETVELHFNVFGGEVFKRYFDKETKLMVREDNGNNKRTFKYIDHEGIMFFSEITIHYKGKFYNTKQLSNFNVEPTEGSESIRFPERLNSFR